MNPTALNLHNQNDVLPDSHATISKIQLTSNQRRATHSCFVIPVVLICNLERSVNPLFITRTRLHRSSLPGLLATFRGKLGSVDTVDVADHLVLGGRH